MKTSDRDLYGRTLDAAIAESTTKYRFPIRWEDQKPIGAIRTNQLCILSAALSLVRTGKKIPVSAEYAGRLLIPYCAHRIMTPGRRLLVNRAYKPLGTGGCWVDYELASNWHIPEEFVSKLGIDTPGYFFDDGDSPFYYANRRLAKSITDLMILIRSAPYPWEEAA